MEYLARYPKYKFAQFQPWTESLFFDMKDKCCSSYEQTTNNFIFTTTVILVKKEKGT